MFENHLMLDKNGSEADDSLMLQRNPKNDTLSKHAYTYITTRSKIYFIKIYRSNDILTIVLHLFGLFKKRTI